MQGECPNEILAWFLRQQGRDERPCESEDGELLMKLAS